MYKPFTTKPYIYHETSRRCQPNRTFLAVCMKAYNIYIYIYIAIKLDDRAIKLVRTQCRVGIYIHSLRSPHPPPNPQKKKKKKIIQN